MARNKTAQFKFSIRSCKQNYKDKSLDLIVKNILFVYTAKKQFADKTTRQ